MDSNTRLNTQGSRDWQSTQRQRSLSEGESAEKAQGIQYITVLRPPAKGTERLGGE